MTCNCMICVRRQQTLHLGTHRINDDDNGLRRDVVNHGNCSDTSRSLMLCHYKRDPIRNELFERSVQCAINSSLLTEYIVYMYDVTTEIGFISSQSFYFS